MSPILAFSVSPHVPRWGAEDERKRSQTRACSSSSSASSLYIAHNMDSTPSTPPPKPENTITPFPYANLLDGPFDADDFRERLRTDGYAVIPCMSRERALDLRQQAFGWLERWGLDRNDPTTWDQSRMPLFTKWVRCSSDRVLCATSDRYDRLTPTPNPTEEEVSGPARVGTSVHLFKLSSQSSRGALEQS